MSAASPARLPPFTGDYCNVLALQRGLHPAGHADSFDDLLLLETPLPWRRELYEAAGALPQEMIDLYALWLRRYQEGQPYNHRALQIAPDPAYSQPGHRRLLFYTRPPGPFAEFAVTEYLVPDAEAGALAWALYEDRARLGAYERYRVPPAARPPRDLLVCTHGTVDVACARFGYPLYRHLRDGFGGEEGGGAPGNGGVRVWRATHFGGHVFAPTLIDLPGGLYWAYVTPAQAQPIVERSGDVRDLAPHLRGWAGLASSYAQAADCALWQRHGWDWLRQARQGQILTQHEGEAGAGASAVVRIDAAGGGEMQGVYTLRVAVTHTVATRVSTGDAGDSGYAQYSVIG